MQPFGGPLDLDCRACHLVLHQGHSTGQLLLEDVIVQECVIQRQLGRPPFNTAVAQHAANLRQERVMVSMDGTGDGLAWQCGVVVWSGGVA